MQQREEKVVLGTLEINREQDRKFKPRTSPQIDSENYAKWLTDRYNQDTAELKAKIEDLEQKLRVEKGNNKVLREAANGKRLKYMDECNKFSPELMREETIKKYVNQIHNLEKCIKKLRDTNASLIYENAQLKNK